MSNIMSKALFNKIHKEEEIDVSKAAHLVAYGGDTFKTLESVDLICKMNQRTTAITFQITDRPDASFLGLSNNLRLNLIRLDKTVHLTETGDPFHKLLRNTVIFLKTSLETSLSPTK